MKLLSFIFTIKLLAQINIYRYRVLFKYWPEKQILWVKVWLHSGLLELSFKSPTGVDVLQGKFTYQKTS